MRYVTSLRPWGSYKDGLKHSGKVKSSTINDPFLLKITLGLVGMWSDATATSYAQLLTLGWQYCTLSSLYLLCTSAVSKKHWLVTSIILWLSTVLHPVFVANPRLLRETATYAHPSNGLMPTAN